MFPQEIWEKILRKIENIDDLLKLKPVSRNWHHMIDKILHEVNWEDKCYALIPKECIFPTLVKISPKSIYDYHLKSKLRVDNKIWRQVYRSWKKWQLCIKIDESVDSIKDFPKASIYERITCSAVTGEILAVATNEGFIYFCKIYDLKNIFYKADVKEFVSELKFWETSEGNLLAVARNIYGKTKFWNVSKKKELSSLNISAHKIHVNRYGCFLFHKDTISMIICEKNDIRILCYHCPLELPEPNSIVLTTCPYADLIMILSSDGCFNGIHYMYINNNFQPTLASLNYGITLPGQFLESSRLQEFQMFDADMIVALSDEHVMFCFDKNEWHIYNLFSKLHGVVSSVYYHCKLLVLGLDSGTILIFHIKNKSDLENFDFSSKNARTITVDCEPIITINLTDVGGEQFIIATTDRNLHVIRFF